MKLTLAKKESNTLVDKDTLFHGELFAAQLASRKSVIATHTLLVITTCDPEDVTLPFVAEGISRNFLTHPDLR